MVRRTAAAPSIQMRSSGLSVATSQSPPPTDHGRRRRRFVSSRRIQADRWLAKNQGLTDDKMEDALKNESWDISIKILTHFPAVLKYMDQNPDWTSALGDAFINQQPDIMTSIQHLRSQAYALGNLKSGPQQTVTVSDNNIVIQPADGQTI
jgi:hypothetical protein